MRWDNHSSLNASPSLNEDVADAEVDAECFLREGCSAVNWKIEAQAGCVPATVLQWRIEE